MKKRVRKISLVDQAPVSSEHGHSECPSGFSLQLTLATRAHAR